MLFIGPENPCLNVRSLEDSLFKSSVGVKNRLEDVTPLIECLPSMHKAQGSLCNVIEIRHGGTCLSHHLGGGGKMIRSSRLSLSFW